MSGQAALDEVTTSGQIRRQEAGIECVASAGEVAHLFHRSNRNFREVLTCTEDVRRVLALPGEQRRIAVACEVGARHVTVGQTEIEGLVAVRGDEVRAAFGQ